MFSRAAKQGLTVLGRENDQTHCFGSEKNTLPVALVDIQAVHQLQFRKKPKTNMVGAKLVTSKQMRKVKKQRVPAFGIIGVNISKYTVGLEKVVPPIPKSRYQLHLSKQ